MPATLFEKVWNRHEVVAGDEATVIGNANVRVCLPETVHKMPAVQVLKSGERIDVFGEGGGKRTADQMQVHFLGELPLVPAVREGGDSGRPAALAGADADLAKPFFELAARIQSRTEEAAAKKGP